jgi:hypothetical protein
MNVKLKEGQKVLGEDGSVYEIEKGDHIETIKESYHFSNDVARVVQKSFNNDWSLAFDDFLEFVDVNGHSKIIYEWYRRVK